MEIELKWAKIKVLQNKKVLLSLSMHTMAEAIKVLQTLVLNERKTNMQLTLEL
jgi:hypothetical protein